MWDQLNKKALELFQQGKYPDAEETAKKALAEAEQAFGPEDHRVARSLNNLAEIYRAQVKYSEAEPLWKRALQIREQTLGSDHPDLGSGQPARCPKGRGP